MSDAPHAKTMTLSIWIPAPVAAEQPREAGLGGRWFDEDAGALKDTPSPAEKRRRRPGSCLGGDMAQCAFHPSVETNIRCAECDRYMCPKDMVLTPVGYKCRECAKPARGQLVHMRPKQLAGAVGAAAAAGVLGGLLLGQMPFRFFFVTLFFGALVAEAVRRASGGHRGTAAAAIAAVGAVLGGLVGGVGMLSLVFAGVGAFGYLAWDWRLFG